VIGETRILLLRHEEPEEDAHGKVYGSLDVGLSELGARRALALGAAFASVELRVIASSPRLRALETARALAEAVGREPRIDERLREIDFGAFEGRAYEEIEREYPEEFRLWMETPTRVRFPGGEDYAAVRARALEALAEVRQAADGGNGAIVAHGGIVRAMLAECLQMPDEAIFRLDVGYGALSVVEWFGDTPLVRLVNGDAATWATAYPRGQTRA